jgi:hypothetical protein
MTFNRASCGVENWSKDKILPEKEKLIVSTRQAKSERRKGMA